MDRGREGVPGDGQRRARQMEELAEDLRLAMVERDPNDSKNVIVEIRAGTGGDEAGAVRGRPLPDADQLRRAPRVQDRAAGHSDSPGGRLQGGHVRDQGRRRLQRLQVRGRRAPRAARAEDGVAGPHPHLDRDGRRAARGRGGRGRDRPQRPPDRRLPLVRSRRPVGQHDRLGGAHHAQADRHRGLDAGREVPAAEPRARDAGAARAPVRARAARAAGRAGGRPPRAGRHAASARRRCARTTSRRAG